MLPLNIPIDGKIIVALLFETDRAPYVVKNPAYGQHKGDLANLKYLGERARELEQHVVLISFDYLHHSNCYQRLKLLVVT
jgi:hypothetical protein